MRIPAWLVIIGVLAMAGMTLLCSVVSYSASYRVAIDLCNNTRGCSLGDIIQAIFQGASLNSDANGGGGFSPPVLATSTSIPTLAANAPTLLPGQTAEPTTM